MNIHLANEEYIHLLGQLIPFPTQASRSVNSSAQLPVVKFWEMYCLFLVLQKIRYEISNVMQMECN